MQLMLSFASRSGALPYNAVARRFDGGKLKVHRSPYLYREGYMSASRWGNARRIQYVF